MLKTYAHRFPSRDVCKRHSTSCPNREGRSPVTVPARTPRTPVSTEEPIDPAEIVNDINVSQHGISEEVDDLGSPFPMVTDDLPEWANPVSFADMLVFYLTSSTCYKFTLWISDLLCGKVVSNVIQQNIEKHQEDYFYSPKCYIPCPGKLLCLPYKRQHRRLILI